MAVTYEAYVLIKIPSQGADCPPAVAEMVRALDVLGLRHAQLHGGLGLQVPAGLTFKDAESCQ